MFYPKGKQTLIINLWLPNDKKMKSRIFKEKYFLKIVFKLFFNLLQTWELFKFSNLNKESKSLNINLNMQCIKVSILKRSI